jgi:lysophospholipase L1-like esterase
VACLIDADCAVLSPDHRCELGVCRADSSANACVRGTVSANQVLLVGDSFFASDHQIAAYLESFARDAGALPTGERYRDNSRLVANALATGGIADEYAAAVADAEVKVVIMSGGGADVLLGNCDSADASCPVLAAAAAGARDLLAKMASDGVAQVVYVFYPDPVDTNLRAKIDALRPLVQSECENSAVSCVFLDLRSTFAGHSAEYTQADGINPSQAGAQASAAAIWAVMQSACIAQ